MRKLILFLMFLPFVAFAQNEADTTYWDFGGTTSINFSQVSLSNWAAGGRSSAAGVFLLNANANYKKDKWVWDNMLDLGYGLLREDQTSVTKTDDKLRLNSKLGYQAKKEFYYSALFSFNTQFANGYNYPNTTNVISTFMAPAYLSFSLGLDYRPSEHFSLFVSPMSTKNTFVLNDSLSANGSFGVELGKKVRTEIGAVVKANLSMDLMENVKMITDLELFSNYADNPQNIDVNWNLMLNMKINKWLSANLSTSLIYDDDISIDIDDNNDGIVDRSGPRIQFKELLGVGLSFTF